MLRCCLCVSVLERFVSLRVYAQTSGTLRSSGDRQEGSLLSHFFIITFPALLHLSPSEVKKVIKGLASDSSVSLPLPLFKNFPFPPLILLQTPVPPRQKPLVAEVPKPSAAGCLGGGEPSLPNGGRFATRLPALRLGCFSGSLFISS